VTPTPPKPNGLASTRRPLSSALLSTPGVSRRHLYTALVATPGREWTVAQLVTAVPDVSVEAVRSTVNLLLQDNIVEPVAMRRALTFHTKTEGVDILTSLLSRWQTESADRDRPSATTPP
jgi:hypothetical protein